MAAASETEKAISTSDLSGGGKAGVVRLPSSFLDDEDKQPQFAMRITEAQAEKAFSGSKNLFISEKKIEDSQDEPLYLMVDDDIVGAVKFGYSFDMDEKTFSLTKAHHDEEEYKENSFGYRVQNIAKFDTPITVLSQSDETFVSIQAKSMNGVINDVQIWKQATTEERIVGAAVLVPGRTDLHKEVYDEETVRNAAHFFFEHYREDEDHGIDVNHDGDVDFDAIVPVESFVLDREMTYEIEIPAIETDEEETEKAEVKTITFPKGTWIMYARVISDTLWARVKNGELLSWSIKGFVTVRQLRKLLATA